MSRYPGMVNGCFVEDMAFARVPSDNSSQAGASPVNAAARNAAADTFWSRLAMPGSDPQGSSKVLVVALMGLPGAGKSTIAQALVEQIGLRRVCRDRIRAEMFPQCDYSYIEKRAAFRAVLLAVEINGVLGHSSVIDGMTFARREDRERLADVVRERGATLLWLFADCTPAVARARIRLDHRHATHPARDRNPALVDAVAGRFEALPDGVVSVDANGSQAATCEAAVAIVAARLGIAVP